MYILKQHVLFLQYEACNLEYTTKVVGLSQYSELYDKLIIISDELQIQIKVNVYGDIVISCLPHNLFKSFKVLALFYLSMIKECGRYLS